MKRQVCEVVIQDTHTYACVYGTKELFCHPSSIHNIHVHKHAAHTHILQEKRISSLLHSNMSLKLLLTHSRLSNFARSNVKILFLVLTFCFSLYLVVCVCVSRPYSLHLKHKRARDVASCCLSHEQFVNELK